MRRARGVAPAVARGSLALLAVAALASGCSAPPAASTGAHGAQNAQGAHGGGKRKLQAPPARALDSYATKLRAAHTARVAAAKRWGLKGTPLPAPPPPAKKPVITTREGFEVEDGDDLPPVFTTVPTRDKVVFLTIDDGAEKDPEFLRMMSELRVPYTAFLTNYLVKDDYGYFRTMRELGAGVDNHTLHHPYLPGLSYKEQRHEICAMQDIMREQFGRRPRMMRPPYGNYNRDTLVAAKSCGVEYAPIWDEEVYVDHWEYREDDRSLHPGDIVLTHFRGKDEWDGTMVDDMRRFLNKVTAEGYAVARLEDYLR